MHNVVQAQRKVATANAQRVQVRRFALRRGSTLKGAGSFSCPKSIWAVEENVVGRREERRLSCRMDQPTWFEIDLIVLEDQYPNKALDDVFVISISHYLERGSERALRGKQR